MQFNGVDARFLQPFGSVDKVLFKVDDLFMRKSPHLAVGKLRALRNGRGINLRTPVLFQKFRPDFRHDFENKLFDAFDILERDKKRNRADAKPEILTSGVMKLHRKFSARLVYAIGEFTHRFDMRIFAHRKLRERRRAVKIVDARDFRDDKSGAALCAFNVIVHKLLRGFTVEVAHTDKHRCHDHAVFELHVADFNGA